MVTILEVGWNGTGLKVAEVTWYVAGLGLGLINNVSPRKVRSTRDINFEDENDAPTISKRYARVVQNDDSERGD
ncbi:unnamed protein product, partial [Sphenostylis stenocarpa]